MKIIASSREEGKEEKEVERLTELLFSWTKMSGVLVRVMTFVIFSADAWAQQSFQQFENTNQFEKALASVDAIKRLKRLQCVIAISNESLCECLSRNLPAAIIFRSYASIADHEKGSEYRQLADSDKVVVDRCVPDRISPHLYGINWIRGSIS